MVLTSCLVGHRLRLANMKSFYAAAFGKHFAVAITVELVALACIAGASLWGSGHTLAAVESGSMVPTFRVGDAVITKRISLPELQVGDIISYATAMPQRRIISHRVMFIDRKAAVLVTKGDHLSQPDTAISSTAVKSKVVAVMPKLGYAIDFMHSPFGLGLVCLLMVISAMYEFYHLGRARHRTIYRLVARATN